ncbi:MAG: hypothetical protein R3182_14485, partial [Draconibacterium sp.]|nr:hypothetical protein [Draconibacterium sp.]
MSDKINIDKSIREKLEGFSVTPPPHVWDSIQGQMAAQRRKKRMAYIGWISAAAVVVFAFIAGWYFNDNTKEEIPATTVEQRSVLPDKEKDEVKEQPERLLAENEKDVTEEKTSVSEKVQLEGKGDLQTINITTAEKEIIAETTAFEKIRLEFLERIEAVLQTGFKVDGVYLAEYREQDQLKIKKALSESDEMLVAGNISNIDRSLEKESGWILGMHLSPGYASHSASHSSQYARNMTYSGESGNGNLGGGVSIQYKTGKKLRIESGIYYAQNGQKSGNSYGLFAFRDNLDYSFNQGVVAEQEPSFSNAVQMSSDGIAMNSTAGVINMRGVPKGAEVESALESSKAAFANTLNTNGEFSQVFEFVEIPLYLRYNVLDKKLGVELMGGLNAGVIVGNNAYIDNDFGLQNIGSTEDISTINFSGTFGVGLNYALGDHLSLAVEPRLNYYLNSINTNPDVDF